MAGDHDSEGLVKRLARFIAGTLLALVLAAMVFCAAMLGILRAAPGEWSHPLRLGPWRIDISVPSALRMLTHPLVLRRLEGRTLHTSSGAVHWRATSDPYTWQATCAPCTLRIDGLGADAIVVSRVEVTGQRVAQDQWRGDFALGGAPHPVRGRFRAGFDAHGTTLIVALPDTPLADAYGLFAAVIPEVGRARIDGRIRVDLQWRWPQRELSLRPQIDGFAVAGLGTEALLHAAPACGEAPRGFGTWLPRAVIAAEDQRFHEHIGYDLQEITAAWSGHLGQGGAARGASTLSQQVAKLLYTGERRSHVRKLRELLYAVELDRTLGKARVLNLYLAMAPWGGGRCGAASAARHYLHKRVDKLTPMEAAWLASLLHNPDREWTAYARSGQVNVDRVGWVIENLRPLRAGTRDALIESLPGWSPAKR
jgi:hypothetical protein